jgi:hypothetical protein
MANPEHLDLLQQGVDAWNGWRIREPNIRPILGSADLRGANLRGVNLMEADLIGANLMDTILHGANLSLTNLHHAQLVQTNLVDATLTDCSIYGISAWDVKLSEGTKHIPAILGVGVPTGGDAYSGVSSAMRPSLQPYLVSKSAFTMAAS